MKVKTTGILFTVALVCALMARADEATMDQAAAVARSIVARGATMGEKLGASVESVIKSADTNAIYFAVKMRGGGTVITSGDTDLEPVVAILPGNEDFKNLPAEHPLRELLRRDLALRQRFLNERKLLPVVSMMSVNATSSVKRSRGKWETLLAEDEVRNRPRLMSTFAFGLLDADDEDPAERHDPQATITDVRVDPLVTAQWSQSGNGENEFTPGRSVCGCVATATAQIMHYHQWPTNECAVFRNTCSFNGQSKEYESMGGAYDWANMPDNNTGATEEQRKAIGKLTYNCGVAVGMEWTLRSSGASGMSVPGSYSLLGYAQALQESDYGAVRSLHTEENFENYVFPCLDAGYPVQIGIADSNGSNGHSIVGDGYGYLDDGEAKIPYVHINMGWGANSGYNAWYNFPTVPYTATIDGDVTEYVIVTTLTYNILPEIPRPSDGHGAFILSGRMLDEEGAPLANAEVQIEKDGTVVNVVTSNIHGVWGAALGSRGNYTIVGHTEDELSGELSLSTLSANSWGHEMVLSSPSVENMRTLEQYSALDRAIAKAEYGDILEVFTQSVFKASIKVDKPLTIRGRAGVAPALRRVVVSPGARLDVVVGGNLTLEDLDFTRSANNFDERSPCLDVMAYRTLSISNVNGLEEITLHDVNSLIVAGPIASPIYIVSKDIPCAENNKFGRYLTPEAGACANFFFNDNDDELGGYAVEDNQSLVWSYAATVPDAGADVKLSTDDGTKTNYRTFSALLRNLGSGDAEIEVAKRSVKLDKSVEVKDRQLVVFSSPTNTINALPGSEFQVADGGELIISNLVIDARQTGATLFKVTGGEMTLESGTEVCNLSIPESKANIYQDAGVVLMTDGKFTLRPGAKIHDCSTGGNGGAIYAQGGLLALEGGLIQNCSASGMFGGGAICAFVPDARVTVFGSPVISDNCWIANGKEATDNLHLYGPLEINGKLEVSARIGIRMYPDDMSEEGGVIAVATDEAAYATPEAKAFAAHALVNDVNPDLVADWNSAEGLANELVWIKNPHPGEVPADLEYLATAKVLVENSTNLYYNLSDALRYMKSAGTIELLTDSVPLVGNTTLPYNAVIRTMDGANKVFAISHDGDASGKLIVPEGVELTLTNVNFSCNHVVAVHQHAFEVNGGKLTLEAGATISGYVSASNSTRAASAIVVWNGGTFTMKDGAVIHSCRNQHIVPGDANSGTGGAVLIDGKDAKGVFLGGVITNCYAKIGGGVELCNEATAYVSGNLLIADNHSVSSEGDEVCSDFFVEDLSKLYLAGPLSDTASIGRLSGFKADTNLVAEVENWQNWELDSLTNSAAKFFNDAVTKVHGFVVTNETEALVVWSTAVAEDGSFVQLDENGDEIAYFAVGPTPVIPEDEPEEEPEEEPENPEEEPRFAEPEPIAFTYIAANADRTQWTLRFTNAVQWCNYAVYGTNTLDGGFMLDSAQLQPLTNFQWKSSAKDVELVLPASSEIKFWRVKGTRGRIEE